MDFEKVKFGVLLSPVAINRMIEDTILTEKYGYDSVWWIDHLVSYFPEHVVPELFTTMALMGDQTRRIAIGSCVADVLRRHPASIAASVATIDSMFSGRTILGLGAGEAMNLEPFGIPTDNLYGKLREAIQVIRLLWASSRLKPANFSGRFFKLSNAYIQIQPKTRPSPPIWVGAFGPKMLEMTGEPADGWLPFSHSPESYKACMDGPIKDGAEKSKRSLARFVPAMKPIATVAKDPEEARKMVLPQAKYVLMILPDVLKMVAPQISHPGREALSVSREPTDDESTSKIAQMSKAIPDETALKTVIWGNPDQCIGQIEAFIKAGCQHFVLDFRGPDMQQIISTYAKRVIPYFRK